MNIPKTGTARAMPGLIYLTKSALLKTYERGIMQQNILYLCQYEDLFKNPDQYNYS